MVESLFEAVTHTTRELTKYRFSALEFALLVQQPNMINVEITDVEMVAFLLRSPLTLSALFAHKNLAFIGSPGMDTPNRFLAFGRTRCEHGFRRYFIKDNRSAGSHNFHTPIRSEKQPSILPYPTLLPDYQ